MAFNQDRRLRGLPQILTGEQRRNSPAAPMLQAMAGAGLNQQAQQRQQPQGMAPAARQQPVQPPGYIDPNKAGQQGFFQDVSAIGDALMRGRPIPQSRMGQQARQGAIKSNAAIAAAQQESAAAKLEAQRDYEHQLIQQAEIKARTEKLNRETEQLGADGGGGSGGDDVFRTRRIFSKGLSDQEYRSSPEYYTAWNELLAGTPVIDKNGNKIISRKVPKTDLLKYKPTGNFNQSSALRANKNIDNDTVTENDTNLSQAAQNLIAQSELSEFIRNTEYSGEDLSDADLLGLAEHYGFEMNNNDDFFSVMPSAPPESLSATKAQLAIRATSMLNGHNDIMDLYRSDRLMDAVGAKNTVANIFNNMTGSGYFGSEDSQKFHIGLGQFMEGFKREMSGATINLTELPLMLRQYAPLPGESEEIVRGKLDGQRKLLNAVKLAVGKDAMDVIAQMNKKQDDYFLKDSDVEDAGLLDNGQLTIDEQYREMFPND